MILVLVVSLVFVFGGSLVARESVPKGIACMVFFGLCAAVAAINLLPGAAYLELSREHFTYCSLFRKRTVPFEQVREFLPFRVEHREKVGWNYVSTYRDQAALRRIGAVIAGVEGALPDTYGMSAQELAALLNSLRLGVAQ
jgi:hypothetical protein